MNGCFPGYWSIYQKDPLLCPPGGIRPLTPATGGVGDGSDDDDRDGATVGEADSSSGVADVSAGVLLDSSFVASADSWISSSEGSLLVLDTSSAVVGSSTALLAFSSWTGVALSSGCSSFKPKISEDPPPGGRSTLLLFRAFGLNPENIRVEFAVMVVVESLKQTNSLNNMKENNSLCCHHQVCGPTVRIVSESLPTALLPVI